MNLWLLLSLCLVTGSPDREVTHPYHYEHEDPFDFQIRDLEEKYQRYSRKAAEYREKAEIVSERRRRYYLRLARAYEDKARRVSVSLERLQRYERYRGDEDRDQREIERLLFLESQRPLEPPERRRLEALQERVLKRRERTWQ